MLGLAVAFVVAFFWAPLLPAVQVGVGVLGVLVVADTLLLWGTRGGVEADRAVPDKLSMGDPNEIAVTVRSRYRFRLSARVIDEVPVQTLLDVLRRDPVHRRVESLGGYDASRMGLPAAA